MSNDFHDIQWAITFLSVILNSYLIFYFGIRTKHKELEFEKNKELSVVLSNLLDIWTYFSQLTSLYERSIHEKNIFLDKEDILLYLMYSDSIDEESFNKLEESILTLKKYDPSTYITLKGTGHKIDKYRREILLPIIKNSTKIPEAQDVYFKNVIPFIEKQILDNISDISKKIDRNTYKKVRTTIKNFKSKNPEDLIEELNDAVYETAIQLLPGAEIFSKDEFFAQIQSDVEVHNHLKSSLKLMLQNRISEVFENQSSFYDNK